MLKARNKPFVLVFWSRDPDGTQHNQGDSLLKVTPGINGPTSLAAIKNADDNLAELRQALDQLGLAATTDIVVSADHGFSTISKESKTSAAAQASYADVPAGLLPPGFVALDLAKALALPLADPDNKNAPVAAGTYPKRGNGLIGADAGQARTWSSPPTAAPISSMCRARTARSPKRWSRRCSARITSAACSSTTISARSPARCRCRAINLKGSSVTPRPSVVINFRSYAAGCDKPVMCAVNIADTGLQQGQGMHGSFNRADTMNFMAAIGPDFKAGFVNEAPVSNADIGKTMAQILGLKIPFKGELMGRVAEEALPGGASPVVENFIERSQPGARRPRHHPGRPARGCEPLFRRRRVPRPHRRHGRAQGGQPLTAATRQRRNTLSSRPHGEQSFMLRRAASPHDRSLCLRPYSACARTPILTALTQLTAF